MVSLVTTLLSLVTFIATVAEATVPNVVHPNDPNIWYHGRWDSGQGTWWYVLTSFKSSVLTNFIIQRTGTGLTLYVKGLSSLSLQLGPNTTQPSVAVGLSVNYGPFTDLHLTNGTNTIPLASNFTKSIGSHQAHTTVVRFAVEGWQNNNMYLEKIILNSGAKLLPYTPSRLTFQFIGDSLSAVSSSYFVILSLNVTTIKNIIGSCYSQRYYRGLDLLGC